MLVPYCQLLCTSALCWVTESRRWGHTGLEQALNPVTGVLTGRPCENRDGRGHVKWRQRQQREWRICKPRNGKGWQRPPEMRREVSLTFLSGGSGGNMTQPTPWFWTFSLHNWERKKCLLFQISTVAQWCLTLCNPMDCSMPGFPVHHQLPERAQTYVHQVSDAIQSSHPLSSSSPPDFNLSQHQGLFQWVSSLHQVAKVLEFQLHHQSFQWISRTDLL